MTWRVVNKVEECFDGQTIRRELSRLTCMVIHRIGKELGSNAEEIAASFKDTSNQWSAGSYTGGQVPYTYLVRQDGVIEQMLAMSDTGWHSRRWSKPGVGIACLGDFRTEQPTMEMWESLVVLCSIVSFWCGTCGIYGHTELPFASSDPNKECPGKNLSMDRLRADVTRRSSEMAQDLTRQAKDLMVREYGIVL